MRYTNTDVRPERRVTRKRRAEERIEADALAAANLRVEPFGETLRYVARSQHAAWSEGFVWGLTIGALSIAVLGVCVFNWFIG